ncbi:MAG: ATP-binding protein [Gammaproteobacteria bacterium]|nr:ATP-binding protein [Gammaproteobacteria bacterium]
MIERDGHVRALRRMFSNNSVIVLLGSRGTGKTTLSREFAQRSRSNSYFFDLGSAADRSRLDDPELALSNLQGLVVLDEIHRAPHIIDVVRRLLGRPWNPARFLILSSIVPEKLRQRFKSLSEYSANYELPGLQSAELPVPQANVLWLRGGLPASYSAGSDSESYEWRERYVRDFLERDIHRLTSNAPTARIERFLIMLAHCHAQVWNGSELARSLGVSHHTARRYLNILQSAFIVRTLKPWRADLPNRQVKSPRVYFQDTGLLHYCLGISGLRDLERHPRSGASWEGFVLENLIRVLGGEDMQFYFWAAHTGAKVDLIARSGGQLRGFEIRRTSDPRITRSVRSALKNLSLTRMDVVHAGPASYPLGRRTRAISAAHLHEDV